MRNLCRADSVADTHKSVTFETEEKLVFQACNETGPA